MLRPQPAVASVQAPSPRAMSLNPLTCLLASANIGDEMSKPTCTARDEK